MAVVNCTVTPGKVWVSGDEVNPTNMNAAATPEVSVNVPDSSAGNVPIGSILLWSGSIATIPANWALCNGNNGTPDLRNRFVVGAGSTYTPGNKGGLDSVTLTAAQMPNHSHSGTTSTGGAHTHDASILFWAGGAGGSAVVDKRDAASLDPAWSQSVHVYEGGAHNHTFTTSAAGSGASHENRPPFYALAYIMRVS